MNKIKYFIEECFKYLCYAIIAIFLVCYWICLILALIVIIYGFVHFFTSSSIDLLDNLGLRAYLENKVDR